MNKTINNSEFNDDFQDVTSYDFLHQILKEYSDKYDILNKVLINLVIKKNKLAQKESNNLIQKDRNHNLFSPSISNDQIYYSEKTVVLDSQISTCSIRVNKLEYKIKQINKLIQIIGDQSNESDGADTIGANNVDSENFECSECNKENVELSDISGVKRDCSIQNGLQLLEIQELERKRIARDLHDSTVQNLTMMIHKAELCFKLADIDSIRMKLELQVLIGSIRIAIEEMRSIIYDLRPMSIDDLGLVVTIERFIKLISDNRDVHINIEVINEQVNLLPVINLTLFRIVQEACYNALKHAKAKNIHICIAFSSDFLDLVISDDGNGFNKDNISSSEYDSIKGFGLSMMKERVFLLSGKINIDTKSNKGTIISVRVPL